ncbi:MAG: TetR/AcrR family transcriptional regulator [Velocimicrobium sp.]
MGKLDKNKQLKKDALFNTAFELFTTKGINKTTISDIVQQAGVAKGTFYLYFTDKYDVKNKLISKKAGDLFIKGERELRKTDISGLEPSLIFIIDYIINAFEKDRALLSFISKNLSWGVFRAALNTPIDNSEKGANFYEGYLKLLEEDDSSYHNREVMLFSIIELVGGTCHSCILYNEPLPIKDYKPFLYQTIHRIIEQYKIVIT